jgi:hypothetical protein
MRKGGCLFHYIYYFLDTINHTSLLNRLRLSISQREEFISVWSYLGDTFIKILASLSKYHNSNRIKKCTYYYYSNIVTKLINRGDSNPACSSRVQGTSIILSELVHRTNCVGDVGSVGCNIQVYVIHFENPS